MPKEVNAFGEEVESDTGGNADVTDNTQFQQDDVDDHQSLVRDNFSDQATQNSINEDKMTYDEAVRDLLSKTPKSATLILENRNNVSGEHNKSWTYEGPVGILDDNEIFQSEIPIFNVNII